MEPPLPRGAVPAEEPPAAHGRALPLDSPFLNALRAAVRLREEARWAASASPLASGDEAPLPAEAARALLGRKAFAEAWQVRVPTWLLEHRRAYCAGWTRARDASGAPGEHVLAHEVVLRHRHWRDCCDAEDPEPAGWKRLRRCPPRVRCCGLPFGADVHLLPNLRPELLIEMASGSVVLEQFVTGLAVSPRWRMQGLWRRQGGLLWDAALARWMEDPRRFPAEFWAGKRVLDFAGGVGLNAIVALRLGASHVVYLDVAASAAQMAARNMARNFFADSSSSSTNQRSLRSRLLVCGPAPRRRKKSGKAGDEEEPSSSSGGGAGGETGAISSADMEEEATVELVASRAEDTRCVLPSAPAGGDSAWAGCEAKVSKSVTDPAASSAASHGGGCSPTEISDRIGGFQVIVTQAPTGDRAYQDLLHFALRAPIGATLLLGEGIDPNSLFHDRLRDEGGFVVRERL